MLVLSRKKNEVIRINDDISIVIVEIRGDKVRVGVAAPQKVSVHRQEIYNLIKQGKGDRDHNHGYIGQGTQSNVEQQGGASGSAAA